MQICHFSHTFSVRYSLSSYIMALFQNFLGADVVQSDGKGLADEVSRVGA